MNRKIMTRNGEEPLKKTIMYRDRKLIGENPMNIQPNRYYYFMNGQVYDSKRNIFLSNNYDEYGRLNTYMMNNGRARGMYVKKIESFINRPSTREFKLIPNNNPFNIQGNRYGVNNYGVIYDYYKCKYKDSHISSTGYWHCSLSDNTNNLKIIGVHRLVGYLYCINPYNDYSMFINHKDGNPLNNHYTNLEWVTPKENTAHAYNTGLITTKRSQEFIKYICELLQSRKYTVQELYYNVIPKQLLKENKFDNYVDFGHMITGIKKGTLWFNISKYYDIPETRKANKYDDNTTHKICKLFEKGYCYREIIDKLNLEQSEKILNRLRDLHARRSKKYITDLYKW